METKIIRRQNIKPETPTPPHLRTYKLSMLDQIHTPAYMPFVYFYVSSDQTSDSLINSTLSLLRKSLSKTLVKFYPFAGKISRDGLCVECNDDGLPYVEAHVTDHNLEQILSKPDGRLVRQLIPPDALSHETHTGSYVLMIQVNVFKCGGMAIAIAGCHRLIDGVTGFCFNNAWAATARGSSELVVPSFDAPSLFPQNTLLPTGSPPRLWMDFLRPDKCVTKRFVFNSSALSDLRAKASNSMFIQHPSRVEATLALIWGCAMAALRQRNGHKRPSALISAVDLRRRMVPPLPNESLGNLVWPLIAVCNAEDNTELHRLVGVIREASVRIDSKFIHKLQNKFHAINQEFIEACSKEEVDYLTSTSLFNCGIYQADFGWGEPAWVCYSEIDLPWWLRNSIQLMETKSGDGIEAYVTMKEQDMAMLEKDPELLVFASIDPTPLNY